MKRLVTFGDSFTYGQGLDGTKTAHPDPHPGAWPEHLGKLLGVDTVLNQSCPGSSNKLIWLTALNFEFQPGDIVVFCWSCNQRWLQIRNIKNKKHIVNKSYEFEYLKQYGGWMEEPPDIMEYYMHHWHPLDALHDFCSRLDHIQKYVSSITGNTVFHSVIPQTLELCQLLSPPQRSESYLLRGLKGSIQEGNESEEQLFNAALFGRPHWCKTPVLATMDPELYEFGESCDGHLAAEGHPVFASRLLDLMLKENTKLLD